MHRKGDPHLMHLWSIVIPSIMAWTSGHVMS
jgi:hypothetical protein